MPLEYTVNYWTGTTQRTLNDVLSFSCTKGRRLIIDEYAPGTATITCRNIAAWPAPVRQGQFLSISNSKGVVFGGVISDVQINYGLKSSLDEAVISVEGPLRYYGRTELVSVAVAQNAADTYLLELDLDSGIERIDTVQAGAESIISAQTFTGNALDVLNQILLTDVGRIWELFDAGASLKALLAFYGRNQTLPGYRVGIVDYLFIFWDQNIPNQGVLSFDSIEFSSSSENYYTRVNVAPEGLAMQRSSTGSAPYQELTIDSYDYTTTQAKSLSQYYLAAFGSTDPNLMSISATYNSQPGSQDQEVFEELQIIQGPTDLEVRFRGSTYYSIIEGMQIDATPSDTRITLNLSDQDLNSYLRWGTPAPYNKWDSNKWGF